MANDQPLIFVKSSYSNGQGDCVEVAKTAAGRAVRDSKDLEAGTQFHTAGGWEAFIRSVKAGEFNA